MPTAQVQLLQVNLLLPVLPLDKHVTRVSTLPSEASVVSIATE